MPDDLLGQLFVVWNRFIAAMTTPEGQALLDAVEYVVKDVMDGPNSSPPQPPTPAEIAARRGPRVTGGQAK